MNKEDYYKKFDKMTYEQSFELAEKEEQKEFYEGQEEDE